ncbi:MaoC family dehydratase N-terminal domain-containing protein [Sporichthya sp.]|uniref:FAS1-like dehydratase domain-containing protein n=1 Tax=Sporichthya sp. TaxID=65475 RepID=UPI0017D800FC|nr:MaoC family dehydratase N-terminal domain-containing protein [Sporichthya sp.]MBA3741440.1 MaoC family dehydratase N-terminal domain-containing protein [Sporichthya sp.]
MAQIGQDFSEGSYDALDAIEAGAVRRFLEPLEFDCPLHVDEQVAAAHGYAGIIAPYSGLATWISAGLWNSGDEPIYAGADRNAHPRWRVNPYPTPGPDINGRTATDLQYDYVRPFAVGDKLRSCGRILTSVTPKETRVGRGAFLTWESKVVNQVDALIAEVHFGVYNYVARVRG